MDAGFHMTDVIVCCWDAIAAIASVNQVSGVLWSSDVRLSAFSNIGYVLSRDSCVFMFCDSVVSW